MKKKVVSALLVAAMSASVLAGCGGAKQDTTGTAETTESGSSDEAGTDGGIKEFTAFFAVPGSEINDDNEIQQIIAEKTALK